MSGDFKRKLEWSFGFILIFHRQFVEHKFNKDVEVNEPAEKA